MELAKFARWVVREGVFEGYSDLDSFDIQKKAAECGVIVQTKYDPAIHGESDDAEPGDEWWTFCDELKDA